MIESPARPVREPSLFTGDARMGMKEAIELTIMSLNAYGPTHDHWAIAYSGGKDSSCTLTLIMWLIASGQVTAPKTLSVFYADTRMELLPLAAAALQIIEKLRAMGIAVNIVRAPLDKRFLVYILGRGVPPPNNNTLRWCTRQIKIDPMQDELEQQLAALDGQVLMITGVRQGESAIRDRRIVMSCSKDGAECGQGWYQKVLPEAAGLRGRLATLAPILHWRVCHVWDWLMFFAPTAEHGSWPTRMIADAYGGDEAEEINARTGCTCCPLAQKDTALDTIIAMPAWSYLAPIKQLRDIYREMREPRHRLRKPGREALKGGGFSKNPQRLGPLTLEARRQFFGRILAVQFQINAQADVQGRPRVDMLDDEEIARIRELIAAGTYPDRWDGDEPTGDVPLDAVYPDGSIQPLLV